MSFGHTKQSGWKCYIPDDGQEASDAWDIMLYSWQRAPFDADGAAQMAAEQDWSDCGGDRGLGDGPDLVIISPTGEETRFRTNNEASVTHYVTQIDEATP